MSDTQAHKILKNKIHVFDCIIYDMATWSQDQRAYFPIQKDKGYMEWSAKYQYYYYPPYIGSQENIENDCCLKEKQRAVWDAS